jgi:hypothetical protein
MEGAEQDPGQLPIAVAAGVGLGRPSSSRHAGPSDMPAPEGTGAGTASGTARAEPDFWDIGDESFAGVQLPDDAEFSNLNSAPMGSGKPRTRPIVVVALFLIMGIFGYCAYEIFIEDTNPLDQAVTQLTSIYNSLVGHGDDVDVAAAPGPKPRRPAKPLAAPAPAGKKAGGETRLAASVQGNPYWSLPNSIVGSTEHGERVLTPEEEETLRAGLTHRFTYQRFKTVWDIRHQHRLGADAILWDAMRDKKFWTRMYAAIALAETNVEVSLQSLEGAMAGARSELVANFFERFTRHPNAGQLFIMRQVLRVLDERGRLVVLKGIHKSKDSLRDLYMTAATQDPGRRVQAWVKQALLERPMAPDRYNDLLAVVKGRMSGDAVLSGPSGTKPASKGSGKGSGRGVPGKQGIKTQDDLDAEGDDMDDGGNVEFFNVAPGKKKVDDTPDPQTFDVGE